jgi:hypothetical protein
VHGLEAVTALEGDREDIRARSSASSPILRCRKTRIWLKWRSKTVAKSSGSSLDRAMIAASSTSSISG